MKVLHITNAYPYGEHPEFGCFVKEQIESLSSLSESKIFFINAHQHGKYEYIKSILRVRKEVSDVDIIHCHHLFSFLVLRLGYFGRKKVVLSFLNDWTKEVKLDISEKVKSMLCNVACKLSHRVIFKSHIPSFLSGSKYHYLPNGVDINRFSILSQRESREKLKLLQQARYILFVSSKNIHRRQKRYDIYLEVMSYLEKKYPAFNYKPLTMSTDDRETALLKINASSLHLLCSDYEGSPNSVKEALACGVPVIARNAGSVSDLLSDVEYSELIDTSDPVLLGEAIHQKLSTGINRENIRESFLEKGLSKEQVAKNLMDIYYEITKE